MTTFTELGIAPDITDALASAGIVDAFPIQEMTLPIALAGTDLIGQARTGTGKTLAFALPVVQRTLAPSDPAYGDLAIEGAPQALIITPTRELAVQVGKDIELATKNRQTRNLTIYGGVPYEPQLEALESGIDIVVGTPGRVIDLVDRGALNLRGVRTLVLDEADEMLDLGFLPDVEKLLAATPASRQTLLFSATMPSEIMTLARQHMTQPMNIRAEAADTSATVPATEQFVWQAHDMDKPEIVARILQAKDVARVIVFTRTKRAAQRLADDLAERGFGAAPLHGDMAQKAREKTLEHFREGKITTLVATDVAARGIDVAGISHVINYTCPEDDKTYVHRIGRTGRAGATGIAVTFVDWADLSRWKLINAALDLPFAEPVETYSTSDHLFTDLNIDPTISARIAPAGTSQSRKKTSSASPAKGGKSAPRRRSRTAGGNNSDRPATKAAESAPQESSSTDEATPRRRRRRRRTRNGAPLEGNTSES